jgi:hypothetical protein
MHYVAHAHLNGLPPSPPPLPLLLLVVAEEAVGALDQA